MAKTTTSLYYIICSQLLNYGYNEFISEDGNQLSFFDPSRRVMGAICEYQDLNIRLACQQTIFFGLSFLGVKRLRFEKEFINRFINRNIKFQTYETARNLLVAYALQNSEMITALYSGENFIQSKSESSSTNAQNSESNSKNASLFTDLPQDNVNVNLDENTLNYATNKTISKSNNTGNTSGNTSSTSTAYSIDNMTKLYEFREQMFSDLDKMLFSQIY